MDTKNEIPEHTGRQLRQVDGASSTNTFERGPQQTRLFRASIRAKILPISRNCGPDPRTTRSGAFSNWHLRGDDYFLRLQSRFGTRFGL